MTLLIDRSRKLLALMACMLAATNVWAQQPNCQNPSPTPGACRGVLNFDHSLPHTPAQSICLDCAPAAVGPNAAYTECLSPPECTVACDAADVGSSLYWKGIRANDYRHHDQRRSFGNRAQFYASLQAVALFRDELAATNVVPNVSGGMFDASNRLETEFDHSVQATIGAAVGDWYRLDFSWMGEFEWSDQLRVDNGATSERIDFDSNLVGAELNLRRRVKLRDWPQHYPDYWNAFELSSLIGVRYLGIDERLVARSQSAAGANLSDFRTDNEMWGVQIGLLSQWLFEDRGWLDWECKGALMANEMNVGSQSADNISERSSAYLVEGSLTFTHQFSRCLTLRLGYQFLWISGTALVSDYTVTSATVAQSISHDGESIYHGPAIGLVFTR